MEEFVMLSGTLIELHIAEEITGLTQEELRKSKNYVQVEMPEIDFDYPW